MGPPVIGPRPRPLLPPEELGVLDVVEAPEPEGRSPLIPGRGEFAFVEYELV